MKTKDKIFYILITREKQEKSQQIGNGALLYQFAKKTVEILQTTEVQWFKGKLEREEQKIGD